MATAGEPLSQTASSLRLDMEIREHDNGFSVFAGMRPRLFGIAYRILGGAAAADDIVQDVWLRWQSTNRSVVENPPAFLATGRSAPELPSTVFSYQPVFSPSRSNSSTVENQRDASERPSQD